MADKKVTIKVDLDAEPSIAQLRKLKAALKETAAGSDEFNKIKAAMNDVEDALKSAKSGADNFAEIVGQLPGPVGELGNKIGGTISTLKQFGGIKLDALKNSFSELGKDFVDAGKGIANLTGLTKVFTVASNGASKALQFFGVSAEGAATASKAFGLAVSGLLAATGLILLTTLIQVASEAWDNYANKAERAAEAQKKANEALLKGAKAALDAESAYVKRSGDLLVAEAKARGANAEEIYKIEQQNRQLLLASQERYYKELNDKDSDEARAALINIKDTQNSIKVAEANFRADQRQKGIDNANKNKQTQKQLDDQKLKDIEAAGKAETDAYLSTLSERDKELYEAGQRLNAKLAAVDKAGVGDKKLILDAYNKEVEKINKKHDDVSLKAKEEFEEKAKQIKISAIKDETDRTIAERQSKYDKDLADLEKDAEFIKSSEETKNKLRKDLLTASENDIAKIKLEAKLEQAAIDKGEDDARYARLASGAQNDLDLQRQILEQKKAADDEYYANALANENLTAEQIRELNDNKLADQIFYTEKSNEIERNRIAVKQKALDDIISIAGAESDIGRAALVAKQLLAAKELIMEVKRTITFSAQAAARSTVAVAEGTAQTAKVGFPQNIPLLIAYAAQAFGIISAIKAAVSNAKSAAGGEAGAGGGSIPNVSMEPPRYGGATTSMAAPQIQTSGGINPATQIAQTITGTQAPLKAYVISGEISSQQALDRRTSRAATFAGG